MKKKSFLVVGAGSFGQHLCRCLTAQGGEVLVVDRVASKVEGLLDVVDSAKIGDCTNPEVLRSFGVEDFDACFVCIGENFQNSLVITDMLKELGAQKVFSEATKDRQEKFLRNNGADHVVFPEKDIAYRLAVSVCNDSVFDYISLSDSYGVFEIAVPAGWTGKSLRELDVRAVCGLNVLAYREGEQVHPMIDPDYIFGHDEHLMVVGSLEDVRRAIH